MTDTKKPTLTEDKPVVLPYVVVGIFAVLVNLIFSIVVLTVPCDPQGSDDSSAEALDSDEEKSSGDADKNSEGATSAETDDEQGGKNNNKDNKSEDVICSAACLMLSYVIVYGVMAFVIFVANCCLAVQKGFDEGLACCAVFMCVAGVIFAIVAYNLDGSDDTKTGASIAGIVISVLDLVTVGLIWCSEGTPSE